MNTETELTRLENDIKSLKASYPIAGSKAKFYVTKSEVFDVAGQTEVRIRFRPNYGQGKLSFTRLTAAEVGFSEQDTPEIFPPQVVEPQDGSGDVIIKIVGGGAGSAYQMSKIQVTASGTSPGVFSQIL